MTASVSAAFLFDFHSGADTWTLFIQTSKGVPVIPLSAIELGISV
ncbi:hypothetical protein P5G51_008300 [Virgibacillus sp. 179-BFC.A HS]|uniref:Uncharacterized protein n=1 Tax=Tigheibacillus jepli TaxID=3035914 RepID=A0ABU5CHG2_9BACI|nr:hypothetical protein [Virgibacillus sp. 179-BFC.A HS]MDY0405401.1 hypothetical protein [Virgibacillus sp. 179-BFC.A HS]